MFYKNGIKEKRKHTRCDNLQCWRSWAIELDRHILLCSSFSSQECTGIARERGKKVERERNRERERERERERDEWSGREFVSYGIILRSKLVTTHLLDISREYTAKNLFNFLVRHFHLLGCAGSPLIFVPRGRTLLRNAFKILLQFLSPQISFFFYRSIASFVHSLPRTFTFFLWTVAHLISYSLFSIDFCFRFYNGYHVLERYQKDSSNYSIEIEYSWIYW